MLELLNTASQSIKDLTDESNNNSTIQLFQSLGQKVINSNLSILEVNEIESDVCKLVYTKISQFIIEKNNI